MKKILMITLLVGLHVSVSAQISTTFPYEEMDKTATAYFEAYSNLDADGMAAVYHDEINYIDETLAGSGGKAFNVSGKAAVAQKFKDEFFPVSRKFVWNEESRFFSGNQGVFRGNLVVHYKGSINGKSDDITYLWSAPYVVVLTFKDGKIIRQNDYIDYPASSFAEK
ncbi:MAG: nuclear transport factor 2 family protein [Bacteroidota bacterium]